MSIPLLPISSFIMRHVFLASPWNFISFAEKKFSFYHFKKVFIIVISLFIFWSTSFQNFSYNFCFRLDDFGIPFVIQGLLFLLGFSLTFVN